MGASKDLPEPLLQLQGEEDDQTLLESEEINQRKRGMDPSELRVSERHEHEVEVSSQSSEEISINGTGKSSHLKELFKREEEEGEVIHIVTQSTSSKARPTQPRAITLYHRSLFKFKLSCRSPSSSAAPGATSSRKSLGQLFKKEKSREAGDSHPQQGSSSELWWEKAMRKTVLVFRRLSFSVQRCYRISSECCVAGLNYRGLVHSDAATGNKRMSHRRRSRHEAGEKDNIRDHFASFLDTVRETRPMDYSNDQCGWSQEYSSPAQFSWESTPIIQDTSTRQLIQRHQQQPSQSTITTIATTTQLLYYSSNLMTPYEIHHSFRRTQNVDDTKSRPEAEI